MILHVEARCDVGCQRTGNEDMILVGEQRIRDAVLSTQVEFDPPGERMVMAVADGMGGAAAGERASEYALTRLAEMMHKAPADLDGDELCELLDIWATRTHADLLEQGRQDPALAGMGTTAVGLITEAQQAEAILQAGEADLIALARAFLYQPRWGWQAAAALGGTVEANPVYWRCLPREAQAAFGKVSIGGR